MLISWFETEEAPKEKEETGKSSICFLSPVFPKFYTHSGHALKTFPQSDEMKG